VALGLVGAPRASAGVAQPWSQVFAAERDTVVFVGADGMLLRAPLALTTRDTLWTPRRGRHPVRVRVSPDGTRLAWLARADDGDTTELWFHDASGSVRRLSYFSLEARRYGYQHYEPDMPSIKDVVPGGGSFVEASGMMQRSSSNTLAWTADGQAVVLGYDVGLALVPASGGKRQGLEGYAAVSLEALHPTHMFRMDAIELEPFSAFPPLSQFDLERLILGRERFITQDGREATYGRRGFLFERAATSWRVCPWPDLPEVPLRAAGPSKLWWAEGNVVRSLLADSCGAAEELQADKRIVGLAFDRGHGALLWASGRQLMQGDASGKAGSRLLETGSTIRTMLRADRDSAIALVTQDSMIVWDMPRSVARGYRLSGQVPCALFIGPERQCIARVDCGTGLPRQLARADDRSGKLVGIKTPELGGGVFSAFGRDWILLYDPGSSPARTLHAYDIRRGTWTTVENPGICAWQPFERGAAPD